MELWQLKTFSVVAKRLHFTRASEELNLTQPAVSHQIKALEKELGEKLFIRDRGRISLTPQGEIVYSYAKKILDITEKLKSEIAESKDSMSGELKIGAVLNALDNPFPLIYHNFKQKYNDVEVHFHGENLSEDILDKVKSGELDVGLVVIKADSKDLIEVPYGTYEVVLVVGADHPLAGREKVSAAELEDAEWALLEPKRHLRKAVERRFAAAGIAPQNIYETSDGSVIRGLVALGKKVSLLPLWGIHKDLEKGILRRIRSDELEFNVQVCLVWKAGRQSKALSALITFLLEHNLPGIRLNQLPDRKI